MSGRYSTMVYTEEGVREGMQIEAINMPVDAKVALLGALSERGLKRIGVGSLVSPPQRVRMDALMTKCKGREPISSPYQAHVEQGLTPFDIARAWVSCPSCNYLPHWTP